MINLFLNKTVIVHSTFFDTYSFAVCIGMREANGKLGEYCLKNADGNTYIHYDSISTPRNMQLADDKAINLFAELKKNKKKKN